MGSCFSGNDSEREIKTSNFSTRIPLESQFDQNSSTNLNPNLNKIHEINTKKEFDELINDAINANVLIVCDFHADWCPPCLQMAPILHKWALNDYKTSVVFVKIDVDTNSDISNMFSIGVLPTFILFKQGKEVCRLVGGNPTSLKKEIDKSK